MKILLSILFSVLFLASCTNDKSNVIVNVNIIGENSDSIQNLIKDAVNNDSARVVNINVYNNVTVESDNKTKVETPVQETDSIVPVKELTPEQQAVLNKIFNKNQ